MEVDTSREAFVMEPEAGMGYVLRVGLPGTSAEKGWTEHQWDPNV